MWGFATQAGAGMAIAGITATYYALANRNYQGERERMAHETGYGQGQGDGPDVHRYLETKDDKITPNPSLTHSNIQLRKELKELSFLNGSVSGLNILYQQQSPLNKFPRSTFEISPIPITSGIDIDPSMVPSDEGILSSEATANIADNRSPSRLVENELFGAATEDKSEEAPASQEGNENDDLPILNENESESEGEKRSLAQDAVNLHRTTSSPICVFKNPDFGNKYAFKTKQEEGGSPLVRLASQLQLSSVEVGNEEREETEAVKAPSTSSSNDKDDSTQFILSPVLSQSTISVYEKDMPEKLLLLDSENNNQVEEEPTNLPEHSDDKLKRKRLTTTLRRRKVEDRSKTRIRIRADPGTSAIPPARKRAAKPVILLPEVGSSSPKRDRRTNDPEVEANHLEDRVPSFETLVKKPDDHDKWFYEELRDDGDDPREGVLEEPLLVPSKCKLHWTNSSPEFVTISNAPAEAPSWRSLPVQVYRTAMGTMPWPLLGICAMVVIIAGFFGMFLINLANEINSSKGVM